MIGGVRTPTGAGCQADLETVMGTATRDLDLTRIKIMAQSEFVREAGGPLFAPGDGRCWKCGRQIYEAISLERAGSSRITGCPHCKHSFCG